MATLSVLARPFESDYAIRLMPRSDQTAEPESPKTPTWANVIRARRAYLAKSQERMVAESNDVLNQTDISRVEKGALHPVNKLPVAKFFALLEVFEWSVEEFSESTGIDVPYVSREQAEAIEAARHLEVHPTYIRFPVYAAAAAGASDPDPRDGEVVYIPREKLQAKGADPRYVVVYRANGDCMVSNEARLVERNIANGDYIAVDTRRRPQPGETVVAWWPEAQQLVVKRYKVEEEGIILYPLAPGHPSLVLSHEDDTKIIGVVVWREG